MSNVFNGYTLHCARPDAFNARWRPRFASFPQRLFPGEGKLFSAGRSPPSTAGMALLEEDTGIPVFLCSFAQARAYAGNEALKRAGEAVDDLLYIPVRDGVVAGILYGGKLFLSASGAGVPARNVLGKAGVAVIDHARSGLSGDAWEIAACFPEKAFSIAT